MALVKRGSISGGCIKEREKKRGRGMLSKFILITSCRFFSFCPTVTIDNVSFPDQNGPSSSLFRKGFFFLAGSISLALILSWKITFVPSPFSNTTWPRFRHLPSFFPSLFFLSSSFSLSCFFSSLLKMNFHHVSASYSTFRQVTPQSFLSDLSLFPLTIWFVVYFPNQEEEKFLTRRRQVKMVELNAEIGHSYLCSIFSSSLWFPHKTERSHFLHSFFSLPKKSFDRR